MKRLIPLSLMLMGSSAFAQVPQLVPRAVIGCESCSGPALLTSVQAIGIAAGGRILIVDRSDPMVRVFDPQGVFIKSMARAGQGPGELQQGVAVSQSQDGTVHVVDMMRRAVVRFDSAGRDEGSVQIGGFATMADFAPGGQRMIAGVTSPMGRELTLMTVTADKATELTRIGPEQFAARGTSTPASYSAAVAADGSIAFGDGATAYTIRWLRPDGTVLRDVSRKIDRVDRTPEQIRAATEARNKEMDAMRQAMRGRGGAGPATPAASVPAPRNYFSAYAMQFDEKGRLWVRVDRAPEGKSMFDVFSSAGEYLGEVRLDVEVFDFDLGNGLLVALARPTDGVPKVHVWTAR